MTVETNTAPEPKPLPPPRPPRRSKRRLIGAAALVAALAVGAGAGIAGTRLAQRWRPQSVMLLQPAPIAQMHAWAQAAVRGDVQEIFGNKFIIQDPSGRALVDTGPRGEGETVVAKGEAVTVQGQFDRGVLHANVVVHPDGRSEAFGPPPPPPPHWGFGRGPDRGAPPPPPDGAAPPPPPVGPGTPPPPPAGQQP